MLNPNLISQNALHLWPIVLPDFYAQRATLTLVLSDDEKERAIRFLFEIHQQRFIVARSLLRQILSSYTGVDPQKIKFIYGPRGKPFLSDNPLQLQFNLSHSHDMAVVAVTGGQEVGVDIEKINLDFKDDVAKRFFSSQEYTELSHLKGDEQVRGFYCIWSKKEALIKALGEGLYAPLDTFSVSSRKEGEIVSLSHDNNLFHYQVTKFFLHPDYAAAYATNPQISTVEYKQIQNLL